MAEFIGSPAMNLMEATLERADGQLAARLGSHALRIPGEVAARRPALEGYLGRPVALGIRPEDLEDASLLAESPTGTELPVQVEIREDMGSEIFLHFALDAAPVRSEAVVEAAETAEGTTPAAQERFVARVGRESRAAEQERVELVVDTRMLHFFDLESGLAIRT